MVGKTPGFRCDRPGFFAAYLSGDTSEESAEDADEDKRPLDADS
jgi:hypothetical protein